MFRIFLDFQKLMGDFRIEKLERGTSMEKEILDASLYTSATRAHTINAFKSLDDPQGDLDIHNTMILL